jgi:hypothetical protein
MLETFLAVKTPSKSYSCGLQIIGGRELKTLQRAVIPCTSVAVKVIEISSATAQIIFVQEVEDHHFWNGCRLYSDKVSNDSPIYLPTENKATMIF